MILSKRGFKASNTPLRIDLDLFFEAIVDQFHPKENPNGKFLLNVAENKLCWPLLREKLHEIMRSQDLPDWVSGYTASLGHPMFRKALTSMISKYIAKTEIDPNYIGVQRGATSVIEVSSFLLGDPGDTVVFPAPSYPVYKQDIGNIRLN